jgi:DNA repair exonuclease SbcCD ATPase subunit
MIRLKELTVKNFMSVGNQTQAVDFGREQLTLVLGENLDQGGDDSGSRNGTGKTTIVNALSYALYGQALTSIKKDNLINKINNKNMLVTLTFEKLGNKYRVERGRKPTVMRFFVNDTEKSIEEIDDAQGDMRETQKNIDELLGMTHTMFQHIVALNTYTQPFLSLRANDQREIIEQLLGITILSEKAENLKEQIRLTKDQIQQETANIEAIKRSNERIQQSISGLETKQSAWHRQQELDLEKIAKNILELKNVDIDQELLQHSKLESYNTLSTRITSLNKERATLDTALDQAEKNYKKFLNNLEQLAAHLCPACKEPLNNKKHQEMKKEAANNLNEAARYLKNIDEKLSKVVAELDEIGDINGRPTTFYDTFEEALKYQNNLNTLEAALIRRSEEIDPYQEQIDELRHTALQNVSWNLVNELTLTKDHQEFLLKLLTNKDSFIRKKIIDQNLAYLNNRLTFYLDRMGLPHQVTFLNDLNVEITQLGQELDFDNLSRGERNRLILGLSWSFRDVWESLYQNINLLFIDELIDNGLDAAGVENALALLKKMARDRNKNIYLISHKDELVGRVNNVLKVIKENGFTSYANDLEFSE